MNEPSIEQMRQEIAFIGPEDTPYQMPASRVRLIWRQQQASIRKARENARRFDRGDSGAVDQ